MTTIAPALTELVGSPAAPDSLKDADNLSFLAGQPADVRAVWLERCRLLRWVDQLAERDRRGFGWFLRAWRAGEHSRFVPEGWGEYAKFVHAIGRAWAPTSLFEQERALRTWAHWLDALAADYGRSLVPATLDQHDEMAEHVGGFFTLFPYLTADQRQSIEAFGALDQAWNNVRDIAEDAAAGRCYFPELELNRFQLSRHSVIGGGARRYLGWVDFMSFWLGEHLPRLRERASAFLSATDLHPSVGAMRASCLRRYERIERVMRAVDFDYRAFPEAYEAEVRRELAAMALGAKEITT